MMRHRGRWWKIHRWVENHTGFVWGFARVGESAKTTSGYPLRRAWLIVAPATRHHVGSIQVRGWSFYFTYDKSFRLPRNREPWTAEQINRFYVRAVSAAILALIATGLLLMGGVL